MIAKNVQGTYVDPDKTHKDFLIQAHPAPKPFPIVPQRPFYQLVQPTDKASFFVNVNRSGTSGITKSPMTPESEP